MSARILVLGAAGRLGHKAAETFRDAGWIVTSLMRPGGAARAPAHTTVLEIDALDHAAVGKAARGVDVVLHALNPPYTDWARLALPLAPRQKPRAPRCFSRVTSTIMVRRCRR